MKHSPFINVVRFSVFVCAVLLMFGAVAGRLFYLHIVERDKSRQIIAENRYRFDEAQARRGNIYDAEGRLLAASSAVWDIGVDPVAVDVRDRFKLPFLSMILDLPEADLEEKIGWSQSRGKNSRRWIKLADSVDKSIYTAVQKLDIKGVYGNRRYMREYPMGKMAAHVVGFINKEATPVMGVERTMDYYLKGSSGWSVQEVAGNRREMRQYRLRDVEGQDGLSVQLTIDANLQQFVEAQLDEV
jgi:cell division protein FtsI (penicillin-binding protein 3)